MHNIKLVRFEPLTDNKIEVFMRGYIRISTNGVLQIVDGKSTDGRISGSCLLALPEGEWISAEVLP